MTTLDQRKRAALSQKLAALDAEFAHWLAESAAGRSYEKHHTQIRALTAHLDGLRTRTKALFDENAGQVLAESRNIESLILGIRRIWEFFRSKLVQRRDDELKRFLRLADELAWACYKPALDRTSGLRREPPLVFLNGGLSPFALSRDRAFTAEEVAGEALGGRAYDAILRRLPIPLIGVPWYQTAYLPDLPVVAHETGHVVEHDCNLHGDVVAAIGRALQAHQDRIPKWLAWSEEIFADFWGCLTLGPAYASSLADFLATDANVINNEIAEEHDKYPTVHLRMLLCFAFLDGIDFKAEAAAQSAAWAANFSGAMRDLEDDVPLVAAALLNLVPSSFSGRDPLRRIQNLPFSRTSFDMAAAAATQAGEGRVPDAAGTATRLVAAARDLYDRDPERYLARGFNERFVSHSGTIIEPGLRSGEQRLDQGELDALRNESFRQGQDWFDEFADLLKVPVGSTRGSPVS